MILTTTQIICDVCGDEINDFRHYEIVIRNYTSPNFECLLATIHSCIEHGFGLDLGVLIEKAEAQEDK